MEVPCLRGKLYPVGVATVGAWTSTRGVLTELLALDPAVYVRQRGDSEAVVAFPPPLLDAVAGILRPRRRRTLAPERARAIGSGTAFSGAQRLEDAPGRTAQARDEETAEVRA